MVDVLLEIAGVVLKNLYIYPQMPYVAVHAAYFSFNAFNVIFHVHKHLEKAAKAEYYPCKRKHLLPPWRVYDSKCLQNNPSCNHCKGSPNYDDVNQVRVPLLFLHGSV